MTLGEPDVLSQEQFCGDSVENHWLPALPAPGGTSNECLGLAGLLDSRAVAPTVLCRIWQGSCGSSSAFISLDFLFVNTVGCCQYMSASGA